MRNFFWFLLGFVFSWAVGLSTVYAIGTCQDCTVDGITSKCIYTYVYYGSPVSRTLEQSSTALHGGVGVNGGWSLSYGTPGITYYTQATYTQYYYWNDGQQKWIGPRSTYTSYTSRAVTPFTSEPDLYTSFPSGLDPSICKIELNCNDSDSDGVCDKCDLAPNDSTLGKTGYVKGYYEYEGKIVAGLTSYSPTNTTYDAIEIYENDVNIPGYVLGLGMPTYIDEKEFIAGGGKFHALENPSKVYDMECATVASLDQCSDVPCNVVPAGTPASNVLPDSGKGETEASDTDQKAEDAGLMDLNKSCSELRTKCALSCGGYTKIQSFACSTSHMSCECLSGGAWELAEDWDELGQPIDSSEEGDTPSTSGDGETSSGGGGTTSVSGGDSTGFTGSYGYVEGVVDFDSFGSHLAQFNSKFPFSLRSTIGSIYSDFKGVGAAPVYSYSVYGKTVTIDLSAWDDIAKMVRSFFALGITLSTIVLLIYLYVGIDLRGK